ncbi:hypothetical protein GGD41_000916 [Paraburkholderia bryophila]|uniref:Lipoprotein n=1 Tax=Paraburkholderia bryophila TaxID=420952 RepID=A0A7Y9W536_9BURK|nr:hypothetical protein [Paraburkholderia bryophila]
MKRLVFVVGTACAACIPPAFAQSNPALQNSVFAQPATTTTFPSASVAQNFQYINHPPAPAPASAVAPSGGGPWRPSAPADVDGCQHGQQRVNATVMRGARPYASEPQTLSRSRSTVASQLPTVTKLASQSGTAEGQSAEFPSERASPFSD